MKCPQCGAWNRAYMPKCTKCGAPLSQDGTDTANWEQEMHEKKPSLSVTTFSAKDTSDEIRNANIPTEEINDPFHVESENITDEIEELNQRRIRGKAHLSEMKEKAKIFQKQLSETTIILPIPEDDDRETTGQARTVHQTRSRQSIRHSTKNIQSTHYNAAIDSKGRRLSFDDGNPDVPIYYDGYSPRETYDTYQQGDYFRRKVTVEKPKRKWYILLIQLFVIIVICAGVSISGILAARYFVLSRGLQIREDTETIIEVSETVVDDHPAHTIVIRGRENATVYIPETNNSYVIADGMISLTIPDYMWYDTESSLFAKSVDTDVMDITLNPTIRYTQEGQQYSLDPISFSIDVPLSPIHLINPSTSYAKVGVSIYEVRINVQKGSSVVIDGTNVSSLIRETGNVSKNVQVFPIGENVISISVKSKYCRENTAEIVLYREPQDIPLELNPTVIVEWNYENDDPEHVSSISGTTLPGAAITVETPHRNLHVDYTTGAFKFQPLFNKLGDNEIIITASADGRTDSTISHIVYYMPTADVYTRKAWDLDSQYSDLITYINLRIGTIYVATGKIQRIISSAPQMAILDIGNENFEKLVMIENSSKTTWTVGSKYRIYGEAFGMYGSIPRLTVRYTYLEN